MSSNLLEKQLQLSIKLALYGVGMGTHCGKVDDSKRVSLCVEDTPWSLTDILGYIFYFCCNLEIGACAIEIHVHSLPCEITF